MYIRRVFIINKSALITSQVDITKLALAVQLIVLVLVGLGKIGIKVPVVREFACFVYFIFIPGLLILKILKVNVSLTKVVLFSIGASISSITLLSALGNFILQLFFEKPLSEVPIAILLSAFIFLLALLVRARGDYYLEFAIDQPSIRALSAGLLLPVLMTLGRISRCDVLIFILLTTISILPIVTLSRRIDEKYHPILIFAISSSLMLFTSFNESIALEFRGWKDGEIVRIAGIWDPSFPLTHNSLIIPIIYNAVFSMLSGADAVIVIMIFNAIIFSFIPVVLYSVYRKFLDPSSSLLAAYLYALYPFYPQLLDMNRTGFSFIFVVLLLLLLVSDEIGSKNKRLIGIIFAFSLIISHYGTAYLYMILLVPIYLLEFWKRKRGTIEEAFTTPTFIASFFAMAFSWYLYTSAEQNFDWGVGFGKSLLINLWDFFSPEKSAAMKAFTTSILTPSFSLETTKWLLFTLLLFILIGAIIVLHSFFKGSEDDKYAILALVFSSVLIGLPMMGMPRIFGFSLMLSSTLSIKGLSAIFRLIKVRRRQLLLFAVFLSTLALFTYGIVANSINVITGEARDMSLYGTFEKSILESNNLEFKRIVYWGYEPYPTVKSAKWFLEHQSTKVGSVYIDSLLMDSSLLRLSSPREYGKQIITNLTQPSFMDIEILLEGGRKNGYLFLSYHNIVDDFIYIEKSGNATFYKTSDYLDAFNSKNIKIYDNGAGEIYLIG
jgi:uncharacterized membrane protein